MALDEEPVRSESGDPLFHSPQTVTWLFLKIFLSREQLLNKIHLIASLPAHIALSQLPPKCCMEKL